MIEYTINKSNKYRDIKFPVIGYDIGKIDTGSNDILECHWHDEWEFFTILTGQAYFTVNGRRIIMSEKDIAFISNGSVHTVEPYNNKPCHYQSIVFNPSILCGQNGDIVQSKYIDPIILCQTVMYIPHNDALYAMFAKIFGLMTELPPLYEIFIKAYLHELFASVILIHKSHNVKTTVSNNLLDYDHHIKKCIDYMNKTYTEQIYISDLAKMVNMSQGYFIKIFKQLTSLSPTEYLICLRLKKASDSLRGTLKPISHIAMDTGFNNLGYFTRAFQKRYGCTPTDYRKRNLYQRKQ